MGDGCPVEDRAHPRQGGITLKGGELKIDLREKLYYCKTTGQKEARASNRKKRTTHHRNHPSSRDRSEVSTDPPHFKLK